MSHVLGLGDRARAATHDLGLLLGALVLLFGLGLGERALWSPDEGRYAEIPREMVVSGDYVTPRLNGVKYFEKPPLFYWLQAGAIKAFGLNEWSLRLWPAAFAVLGCLAVYGAGRRLYGRRAGMLAAAVLATSPLYYVLGRAVTLDMALTAMLSATLLAFLLGMEEPPGRLRRRYLLCAYALAALATLTKGLIGVVIPGLVIGAWIAVMGNWRELRHLALVPGSALFLAIAAPWHVLAASANPEFAYFYFVKEHLLRYLTTVHDRYQPIWFFVPVLLIGLYPWAVFLFQALRDGARGLWHARRERGPELFLLLWAGLVFGFFSLSHSKLITYILPALPPLALLIARYLDAHWERTPATAVVFWTSLVLGTLLGLAIVSLPFQAPAHPLAKALSEALGGKLYLLAAGLVLAGALPLALARSRHSAHAAGAALLAAAAVLATLAVGLPQLDSRFSIRELALQLKERLRPGDEVVSYHTYYQDLPVYLQRRVTVAGWKGELEFGTSVEDTSAWMIDEPSFQRRWQGPARVYVLTTRADYARLRPSLGRPARVIAASANDVLLVN